MGAGHAIPGRPPLSFPTLGAPATFHVTRRRLHPMRPPASHTLTESCRLLSQASPWPPRPWVPPRVSPPGHLLAAPPPLAPPCCPNPTSTLVSSISGEPPLSSWLPIPEAHAGHGSLHSQSPWVQAGPTDHEDIAVPSPLQSGFSPHHLHTRFPRSAEGSLSATHKCSDQLEDLRLTTPSCARLPPY